MLSKVEVPTGPRAPGCSRESPFSSLRTAWRAVPRPLACGPSLCLQSQRCGVFSLMQLLSVPTFPCSVLNSPSAPPPNKDARGCLWCPPGPPGTLHRVCSLWLLDKQPQTGRLKAAETCSLTERPESGSRWPQGWLLLGAGGRVWARPCSRLLAAPSALSGPWSADAGLQCLCVSVFLLFLRGHQSWHGEPAHLRHDPVPSVTPAKTRFPNQVTLTGAGSEDRNASFEDTMRPTAFTFIPTSRP